MNTSIANQLDQQRGVDIRPSSTAIFGISSFDRYPSLAVRNNAEEYTSAATATISSRQPFISGQFQRIGITEVVLRWTLPTVTYNNQGVILRYRPGGVGPITDYEVLVTTFPLGSGGWYTPTTLAAALQTAIRGITGNVAFTITVATLTGAFTARSNNTDTFTFLPLVEPTEPNRIGLFEMMNWFPGDPNTLLTTGLSGPPSMLRTQFVDIVCSQLTGNQSVKDADTGDISRDVLCRVYLNDGLAREPDLLGSEPFTLHRQFAVPKQIKWAPNASVGGYLKFTLYDDQGYLITSGIPTVDPFLIGDWNLTLQLSEV